MHKVRLKGLYGEVEVEGDTFLTSVIDAAIKGYTVLKKEQIQECTNITLDESMLDA